MRGSTERVSRVPRRGSTVDSSAHRGGKAEITMRKTRKLLELRGQDAHIGADKRTARGARRCRPTPSMLVASCALIAALGGVAAAAIPHSTTGVITACYGPVGSLRVIDAQAGAACLPPRRSSRGTRRARAAAPACTRTSSPTGRSTSPIEPRHHDDAADTRADLPWVPGLLLHAAQPARQRRRDAREDDDREPPDWPTGTVFFPNNVFNASVDPGVDGRGLGVPRRHERRGGHLRRPDGAVYARFE